MLKKSILSYSLFSILFNCCINIEYIFQAFLLKIKMLLFVKLKITEVEDIGKYSLLLQCQT